MAEAQTKVALITGANKGIGFEAARQLGRAGYAVLVGARNQQFGEEAAGKLRNEGLDAHMLPLDLSDAETIAAAARAIETKHGQLDILVNNAGIADPADGPPSTTKLDALERTLRTNLFGAVAVTQAMLPLLRKAPAARIVNVSSGLGSIALNADPNFEYAAIKYLGYSASKAALNMFTVQLAYELRDTPIKVNAADPGYTATDLNQHRGTQTVEQGAAETVRLALLPPNGPTGGFFATEGRQPW